MKSEADSSDFSDLWSKKDFQVLHLNVGSLSADADSP